MITGEKWPGVARCSTAKKSRNRKRKEKDITDTEIKREMPMMKIQADLFFSMAF